MRIKTSLKKGAIKQQTIVFFSKPEFDFKKLRKQDADALVYVSFSISLTYLPSKKSLARREEVLFIQNLTEPQRRRIIAYAFSLAEAEAKKQGFDISIAKRPKKFTEKSYPYYPLYQASRRSSHGHIHFECKKI